MNKKVSIEYRVFSSDQSAEQYCDQVFDLVDKSIKSGAAPFLYLNDRHAYAEFLGLNYIKVLAFDEQRLVGFSIVRMLRQWPEYFDFLTQPPSQQPAALLLNVLVDSDYRGIKIGYNLTIKRLEALKQTEVQHLFVTVHPDNQVNVNTLTKTGFKVLAKREIFQQKLLRLVMYKALA